MTHRSVISLALVLCSNAIAGERYFGGGASTGPSAPLLFLGAGAPKVSVTQLLYTQPELGIPTGGRIIDIAWRKAELAVLPPSGCDVELWMKNVMPGTAFGSGSKQTLAEATAMASKVFSGSSIGLPSAMGFVSLPAGIDAISFDYLGGDLEVTVVATCLAVTGEVSAVPVMFRYDDVPERARYFAGDAAPGATTELTAEPWFVSRRPHTRFRFLNPTRVIALRVGDFALTAGATYGTAAKHLATGKAAPFRMIARNDGTSPIVVSAVTFSGTTNGTPVQTSAPLGTLAPGEEKPLTVEITPTAAAMTRFTTTVASDAVNAPSFPVSYQGTATATPEAQPNLAELKPDRSTTNIPSVGGSIQLGDVPPGSEREVKLMASNFGAADGVPVTITVVQQPTGGMTAVPVSAPALDAQKDEVLVTRVRAPSTAGMFTTVVRVTIGTASWDVTVSGTVKAPELDVDGPNGPVTTPAVLPLGTLALGEVLTREFTLKNTGSAPLHIIAVLPGFISGAEVRANHPFGPLAPGASIPLIVTMTVTAANTEVVLNVLSDDSDEKPFKFQFTSSSAAGPRLGVTEAGISIARGGDFSRTLASKTQTVPLRLLNLGDAELTVSRVVLVGLENSSPTGSPSGPITIPAGGSVLYDITPAPMEFTSYGSLYRVSVSIESNDPAGPFELTIHGSARAEGIKTCSVADPGALLLAPWLALLTLRQLRRRRSKA